MRTSLAVVLLVAPSLVVACGGGGSSGPDAPGPDAVRADARPAAVDAAGSDAAGPDAASPDAASPDAPSVDAPPPDALPMGFLAPSPYLSTADSPFSTLGLATFHLEDFEDGMTNTPGLTADSTVFGTTSTVDSVDGDDEVIDGACPSGSCTSIFGSGSISFTFDAVALGGLPTHAGVVWTDGGAGCDVTFEAFDGADVSLGTTSVTALGDATNSGSTGEDRFFGVIHPAGVGRIRISNSVGGTEADHVQYGR